MEISRGKYVFFLDSDDAITETALEELCTLAEEFQADVVHCEKFYIIPDNLWHDVAFRTQLKPYNYLTGEKIFIKTPLIWANNFEERIKFFTQRKLIWNIWVQLIRRDFILENELKMPDAVAQDMTFTICELCSAKKYLLVPNIVNYYRVRSNSVSSEKIDVERLISKWLKATKCGIKFIDEFLNARETFSQRSDLKYLLLDAFAQEMLKHLIPIYTQIPAYALDESLRKEFGDGDNTALLTFVFSMMNIYRLQLIKAQSENVRLESEFIRLKSQVEQIVRKLKQE